jgi:hypothetical protein
LRALVPVIKSGGEPSFSQHPAIARIFDERSEPAELVSVQHDEVLPVTASESRVLRKPTFPGSR